MTQLQEKLQKQIFDFTKEMEPSVYNALYSKCWYNHYLKKPDYDYAHRVGLTQYYDEDLLDFYAESELPRLVYKRLEYLTSLTDEERFIFINGWYVDENSISIEDINKFIEGELCGKLETELQEILDGEGPVSYWGYTEFVIQLHKGYINKLAEDRNKQIDSIFED